MARALEDFDVSTREGVVELFVAAAKAFVQPPGRTYELQKQYVDAVRHERTARGAIETLAARDMINYEWAAVSSVRIGFEQKANLAKKNDVAITLCDQQGLANALQYAGVWGNFVSGFRISNYAPIRLVSAIGYPGDTGKTLARSSIFAIDYRDTLISDFDSRFRNLLGNMKAECADIAQNLRSVFGCPFYDVVVYYSALKIMNIDNVFEPMVRCALLGYQPIFTESKEFGKTMGLVASFQKEYLFQFELIRAIVGWDRERMYY